MNVATSDWRSAISMLERDPALAPYLRNAAVFVWSPDGKSILAADARGDELRALFGEDFGKRAHERIRLMGQGLAPLSGVRLERLALVPNPSHLPLTCACRRIRLSDGEKGEQEAVLVLAQLGGVDFGVAHAPAAAGASAARHVESPVEQDVVEQDMPVEAAPHPAHPPVYPPLHPPLPLPQMVPFAAALPKRMRFVWSSDAEGRITMLSPEFLALLQLESPDAVVGRAWAELLGTRLIDDTGALATGLASGMTFHDAAVAFHIGDGHSSILAALSGSPVFDAARNVQGYRGFGALKQVPASPYLPMVAQETGQEIAQEIAQEMTHQTHARVVWPDLDPAEDTEDQQPVNTLADEEHVEAVVEPTLMPELSSEPLPQEIEHQDTGHLDAAHLTPEPAGNDDEPPRLPAVARLQTSLPDMLRHTPVSTVIPGETPMPALRPVLAPAKTDLSPSEKHAFRQIAEALGAQIDETVPQPASPLPAAPQTLASSAAPPVDVIQPRVPQGLDIHADLLDKLPIGVLVSRNGDAAYANRTFLDLLGYDDLADIARHGGMENLFRGQAPDEGGGAVLLVAKDGDLETVEARLSAIAWQGRPATLMSFRRSLDADAPARARALELDLDTSRKRMAELSAILDTATDGVITLDERGRILSLNSAAEALFGYDQREVTGEIATMLFAPESHAPAMDYLDGLKGGGVASVLNDGREVVGMVRQGGRVPLFMTMGRIAEGQDTKFCAVLRDITAWKKAESELTEARKTAEQASAQKSDVLAKISHEIRTPLNAIIGFSEVMAEERFGPMGSERYKEYARDIRESGSYLISLVNDLLDLAKIEAGRLDLEFGSVNLNEIANAAVSLLQPEAARNRVVLRTGLSTRLPPVVADERSLRQIVINLLSNAVKFTDSGGQVIVSTALGDKGEAILRVRDTGIGMTPEQLKLALEPFRQVSATRRGGGTGLGLPLTKALVEANRGAFQISSVPKEGTLAEVVFPPQRVLAE
jgi:PAS domain S-box-containing protein